MAITRIKSDYLEIKKDMTTHWSAGPTDSDLFLWNAMIIGPENTPYEDGIFHVEIKIPGTYPFDPPTLKFTTKIFHPNISYNGYICLDILRKNWSPVLTISKVLLSLYSLLSQPNPNDPLVPGIGR